MDSGILWAARRVVDAWDSRCGIGEAHKAVENLRAACYKQLATYLDKIAHGETFDGAVLIFASTLPFLTDDEKETINKFLTTNHIKCSDSTALQMIAIKIYRASEKD